MGRFPSVLACVFVISAVAFWGCKKNASEDAIPMGAIVKAKLLKNGKPIKSNRPTDIPGYEDMEELDIELVPEGGETSNKPVYYGDYKAETGALVFSGEDGAGVQPGRYVLTVQLVDEMPSDGEGDDTGDGSGGERSLISLDVENSPFTVVIPASKAGKEVDLGTLDLAKPPQK